MGIENAQDFARWSGLTGAIRNVVCLNKDKHIQDNLDSVAHIARLRRNIASALAIYEKENKEYLANKKTEKKNAGTQGATVVKDTQGATQTTQADVLTPEAIVQLLATALASQGATQASTTATQVKKKGK